MEMLELKLRFTSRYLLTWLATLPDTSHVIEEDARADLRRSFPLPL